MKTYGYYLMLHILGLTGLIAAGALAMLHGLWFCTIICGLLLIGICYSLYRIQIRQTETMYRLVECMKQNDLGQRQVFLVTTIFDILPFCVPVNSFYEASHISHKLVRYL